MCSVLYNWGVFLIKPVWSWEGREYRFDHYLSCTPTTSHHTATSFGSTVASMMTTSLQPPCLTSQAWTLVKLCHCTILNDFVIQVCAWMLYCRVIILVYISTMSTIEYALTLITTNSLHMLEYVTIPDVFIPDKYVTLCN